MIAALEKILSANSFTQFSADEIGGGISALEDLPAAPGGITRHVAAPAPACAASAPVDRPPAPYATIAIPGRPATRTEPPCPCSVCGSPLFWISVYDDSRLNCWGCDYPPAWAMVDCRWTLRSGAGRPGELTWEQHPRERWAPRCEENQPLDGDALDVGEAGRGGEFSDDGQRPGARDGDGCRIEFEYWDAPAMTPRGAMLRLHRRVVVTDAEMVREAIGRIEAFENSRKAPA